MLVRLLLRRPFSKATPFLKSPSIVKTPDDFQLTLQGSTTDNRQTNRLHKQLRASTNLLQFQRVLQSNANKQLDVFMVYETFVESLMGWSLDINFIKLMNQLKQNTKTNEEMITRLGVLVELMRYSNYLIRKRDVDRVLAMEIIKYCTQEARDCMNQLSTRLHELNPPHLMSFVSAMTSFGFTPTKPIFILNNYFANPDKEGLVLVPRYFAKFMKGYMIYSWFTRTDFPMIEDFIVNRLKNYIPEFHSKFLMGLFHRIASLRMHITSSQLKLPSCLPILATRISSQSLQLTPKNLFLLLHTFTFLPQQFDNHLLNTTLKTLLIKLKQLQTSILTKLMLVLPENRVQKMLMKQLRHEILNRFRNQSDLELARSLDFLTKESALAKDQMVLDFVENIVRRFCAGEIQQYPIETIVGLVLLLRDCGRKVDKYLPRVAGFRPEVRYVKEEDEQAGTPIVVPIFKLLGLLRILEIHNTNGEYEQDIQQIMQIILKYNSNAYFFFNTFIPKRLEKDSGSIPTIYNRILEKMVKDWPVLSKTTRSWRDLIQLFEGPETTQYFEAPVLELIAKIQSQQSFKVRETIEFYCRNKKNRTVAQARLVFKLFNAYSNKIFLKIHSVNLVYWTIICTPIDVLKNQTVLKQVKTILQTISQNKVYPINIVLFAVCFDYLQKVTDRPDWMVNVIIGIMHEKIGRPPHMIKLPINHFINSFVKLIPHFEKEKTSHYYVSEETLNESDYEYKPPKRGQQVVTQDRSPEFNKLLHAVVERLANEIVYKENSAEVVAECLFHYIQLSPLIGKENRDLIGEVCEKLIADIAHQRIAEETKESIYVMLCLLLLNTKNQIILNEMTREEFLLRVQQFSQRKGDLIVFKPWVNLYRRILTQQDSKKILPHFMQWLEISSSINDQVLPFDFLLNLWTIAIIHKNLPLKKFANSCFQQQLLPSDIDLLCRAFNSRRDTSKAIFDTISANYLRKPNEFSNFTRFQIMFCFAVSRYTPRESEMELIMRVIRDLEESLMMVSGWGTKEGDKFLEGNLLNYMWAILTLEIDYSELEVFKKCLKIFIELTVKYVDQVKIPYLKGLIADIFLILRQSKNLLPEKFVQEMLNKKQAWMRSGTLQNRTVELMFKGKRYQTNFEITEGLLVDYYLPQSNTAVVSLQTFMMDNTYEQERGYSRARDLILRQLPQPPKVIKINLNSLKNSPRQYLEKLFK